MDRLSVCMGCVEGSGQVSLYGVCGGQWCVLDTGLSVCMGCVDCSGWVVSLYGVCGGQWTGCQSACGVWSAVVCAGQSNCVMCTLELTSPSCISSCIHSHYYALSTCLRVNAHIHTGMCTCIHSHMLTGMLCEYYTVTMYVYNLQLL